MVRINDGKIFPEDMIQFAKIFLRTLDEKRIESLKDLRQRVGQTYQIQEFSQDFIEVLKTPSRDGTKAFVLAYNRPDTGVIINAVLNQRARYSQMIIKGFFKFKEYAPFHSDPYGNAVMSKWLDSEEVSEVKKGLEELTDKNNYLSL